MELNVEQLKNGKESQKKNVNFGWHYINQVYYVSLFMEWFAIHGVQRTPFKFYLFIYLFIYFLKKEN